MGVALPMPAVPSTGRGALATNRPQVGAGAQEGWFSVTATRAWRARQPGHSGWGALIRLNSSGEAASPADLNGYEKPNWQDGQVPLIIEP